MTPYRFTLYLAGDGLRSRAAKGALRRLCERRLPPDGYEITVIDVLAAVEQADTARILVTPTIVRTHPLPVVRVIGDLSVSDRLAEAVGLPPAYEGTTR